MDAVVFDFGGVLTLPVRDSTGQWLRSEGILDESYRAVMREWLVDTVDSPAHRLETGELPAGEFETALAARLRTADGSAVVAEGLLGRMFAGMLVDAAMLALAAELRAADVRVAVLSNSWGNSYPADVLARFDPVVISEDVGLRKPDPRIYTLMLQRLGTPAARTAFVDDTSPNVAAAAALGLHALRHADAATTRAALAPLVPGLARHTTTAVGEVHD